MNKYEILTLFIFGVFGYFLGYGTPLLFAFISGIIYGVIGGMTCIIYTRYYGV